MKGSNVIILIVLLLSAGILGGYLAAKLQIKNLKLYYEKLDIKKTAIKILSIFAIINIFSSSNNELHEDSNGEKTD